MIIYQRVTCGWRIVTSCASRTLDRSPHVVSGRFSQLDNGLWSYGFLPVASWVTIRWHMEYASYRWNIYQSYMGYTWIYQSYMALSEISSLTLEKPKVSIAKTMAASRIALKWTKVPWWSTRSGGFIQWESHRMTFEWWPGGYRWSSNQQKDRTVISMPKIVK